MAFERLHESLPGPGKHENESPFPVLNLLAQVLLFWSAAFTFSTLLLDCRAHMVDFDLRVPSARNDTANVGMLVRGPRATVRASALHM